MKNNNLVKLKRDGFISRAAAVDPKIIDEKERTIRTVLATETPALVFDLERWDVVREILVIQDGSVMLPENRQVPLADSHMRSSVKTLKGSIRDLTIVNGELIGQTHFSSTAEDEWTKAREGHLTDVSVGYNTFPEYTVVVAPGETAQVAGRSYSNNFEDKKTLLIRTRWQPKEGSLVIVGADPEAQFRSENIIDWEESKRDYQKMMAEIDAQKKEIRKIKNQITIKEESTMEPKTDNTQSVEEIRAQELARINEIEALGERFAGKTPKLKEQAREAIKDGKTVEEFRNYILDNLDTSAPIETPQSEIGLSKKEINQFSPARAILAAADNKWAAIAPFEREVIDATAKKMGKDIGERSILLPREVQLRGVRSLVAGTGSGANIVGTDLLGAEFVEYLRKKLVLGQAGIRILTGLKDNVAISKQSAPGTISMKAEGTAASASDLTLTQLTASPNTATSNTSYSRKLLLQGDPSIDALVYDDLYAEMNRKRDYMGLSGSGTAPEPEGVANTSGIGSVDMSTATGAVDWSKVVEFESDIESNSAETASMAFITTPTVKGLMKTTQKASNTAVFLLNEQNQMNGYPVFWSQLVAANHLFFGDWSKLMFLEWGSIELIVDPYTNSTSGVIAVTILDEFDFIVRQPGAFSLAASVNA